MSSSFNENTRVQVPATLHLLKLGYEYIDKLISVEENATDEFAFDPKTNILINIFSDSLKRLNPEVSDTELRNEIGQILGTLGNDDLGREFYKRLMSNSGIKLIDFEGDKNVWHVTTEFTCEHTDSGDSFRPDITCFVNGLPLAFIEVKKPNNRAGILAERERIEHRMTNPNFKRFFNLTQLMIFSNNQEYEVNELTPIQGAFYCCTSGGKAFFNFFREEKPNFVGTFPYRLISEEDEKRVLIHRNCPQIRTLPEYQTNKDVNSPTNRILTSMLSRERFLFLLRYGFAYVDKVVDERQGLRKLEKHVMRYQQLFASLSIREKFSAGTKGGVIWHTQGSGKTALAYYNVRNLTDVFAKKNTVAKFYFIVDRIALMNQASAEFKARGLIVRNANSREELMADINSQSTVVNATGKPEIMVVNIQRFKENRERVDIQNDFSVNIQRVFFVDEAHRGYNPTGTFLANLFEADRNSIKIALTGTPLLKTERETWRVFGDYIHTYYYDKSIADGYTLRLMREPVATYYKESVEAVFREFADGIRINRKDLTARQKEEVFECENYLSSLYDYVTTDFRLFRAQHDSDQTLGAMVVCRTNDQARKFFEHWNKRIAETQQAAKDIQENYIREGNTEALANYRRNAPKTLRAALVLDDFPTDPVERKRQIESFRKSAEEFDVIIVNQMLLTGFDAPHLKKLYLGRLMDGHGLLQALTRVNRPYKQFRYGYVVDFVDISENFDATNARYLKELNQTASDSDLPEGSELPGNALFVSSEEISRQAEEARSELFAYTTDDKEEFRKEIDEIDDLDSLYRLRRILENAKGLINAARSLGNEELLQQVEKLPVEQIPDLIREVTRRIENKRLLDDSDGNGHVSEVINLILSQMEFSFESGTQEELVIEQKNLRERLLETQEEFNRNFDDKEPEFIDLVADFKKYLREKGIQASTATEFREKRVYLDGILKRIRVINTRNNQLKKRYRGDEKFVRVHKRIREENFTRSQKPTRERLLISESEAQIFDGLSAMKLQIDERVFLNNGILIPQASFQQYVLSEISHVFNAQRISVPPADKRVIGNLIATEYCGAR
ncbi:MAG: type I restriction endonuclease subunit R [Opitutales bacterium]|nr:type I restriction endonuclease subunit R [Opitutales bacterium]